jgi:hypothetical protein
MIIVEKDRHMTRNEPFFSAHKAYNNWLINHTVLNSENNTFISLGDWYTLPVPKPDEIDETEKFFSVFKGKKFILGGNHDFSETDKTWSIYPLRNNKDVEIVLEPCVKTIEGHTFAFLPFYKHLKNLPPMKDYYSSLGEDFINADFICYHFEDETINFGKSKKGIDLSYLKGKRLGGHVHCVQKNYELGMPIISRYDERGQKNNLFCIREKETFFLDIPKFVDYYSINYGESIPTVDAKFPIWDILDAPSRKQVKEFYSDLSDFNFHDIKILRAKEKKIENKSADKSMSLMFENYVEKRHDLTEDSKQKLREIISKKI